LIASASGQRLAEHLEVAPECVSAVVVGEHGLTSALLWSAVTIGGVSLESYLTRRGVEGKFLKKAVEEYVKQGNINIIRGKGASEFAIGTVIARVVEAIVRDERIVIPCSCYSEEYGVTLSLLHRVGRRGVLDEFEIEGNQEEKERIQRSVGVLKAAMERLNARLSRQQEAGLGQHRDRQPVAEPNAQFAQRAGLLLPTSGPGDVG
jgi:L-lactate dehydrogenase